MQFFPAICPTCSGQLQLPNDKENVKCMYCGNNVIVRKAIQAHAGANIENYLRIADNAFKGGNFPEAYNYFTKVLEFEHDSSQAWFGKATTAGWMSSLHDLRIPEMLSGIDSAVELAAAGHKEILKKKACVAINAVAANVYNASSEHLKEFGAQPNVWNEHLTRCDLVLRGLQHAHFLDPTYRPTIEFIIHICTTNMVGVRYPVFINGKQQNRQHTITPDYSQRLRNMLEQYATYMRRFDPNYQLPALKQQSNSNCAIATAAMGDYDHPDVRILREFRDRVLLRTSFGTKFVEVYYRIGPTLAQPLRASASLRAMSKIAFISPLSQIASIFLKAAGRSLTGK